MQAPAPVKAIARGKATFGTLAHVVVAKFDHHLPLYRQAEMMAAQGIELDRSEEVSTPRPPAFTRGSCVLALLGAAGKLNVRGSVGIVR